MVGDVKQKQVVESKKPYWDTFDEESVEKASLILPKLNPRNNADYVFKLLTVPYEVKWKDLNDDNKEKSFSVVEIFHNKTKKTLSCNQSFLFGLKVEKKRHGVIDYRKKRKRKE